MAQGAYRSRRNSCSRQQQPGSSTPQASAHRTQHAPRPQAFSEGVVTVDKDGNYSDGGAFKGKINEELTALEFNFDSSKFESYQVSGNILTGTVMQDETEAVFGVFIDADVSFMLTIGNNRVQSLALNYELYSGTMKVVCTYN